MTKQHFEAFARAIRESGNDEPTRAAMAHLVAYVAQEFNPRFDYRRFWAACGLPPMSS